MSAKLGDYSKVGKQARAEEDKDKAPEGKVSPGAFGFSLAPMSPEARQQLAIKDQVKGALLASRRDVPGAGASVDAAAALRASATANAGLVRNTLLDPATGLIDWTRASFRRASFRDASGSPYDASWSRASFRCECGITASGEVEPGRASFRRVSFRRTVDFDR